MVTLKVGQLVELDIPLNAPNRIPYEMRIVHWHEGVTPDQTQIICHWQDDRGRWRASCFQATAIRDCKPIPIGPGPIAKMKMWLHIFGLAQPETEEQEPLLLPTYESRWIGTGIREAGVVIENHFTPLQRLRNELIALDDQHVNAISDDSLIRAAVGSLYEQFIGTGQVSVKEWDQLVDELATGTPVAFPIYQLARHPICKECQQAWKPRECRGTEHPCSKCGMPVADPPGTKYPTSPYDAIAPGSYDDAGTSDKLRGTRNLLMSQYAQRNGHIINDDIYLQRVINIYDAMVVPGHITKPEWGKLGREFGFVMTDIPDGGFVVIALGKFTRDGFEGYGPSHSVLDPPGLPRQGQPYPGE